MKAQDYEVSRVAAPHEIEMPTRGVIVHFEEVFGRLKIWVVGAPEEGLTKRKFQVFNTGEDFPEPCDYYASCSVDGGRNVLHLVELPVEETKQEN